MQKSNLIEKTEINSLIRRGNQIVLWLECNVFDPDFLKVANEYTILTVKIYNYYHNNK